MRKIVVAGLCSLGMGMLTAHMGYNFLTLEFWTCMGLMVAYGVNLSMD
jgi:hypothetical protein